jgi:hypothetical protein
MTLTPGEVHVPGVATPKQSRSFLEAWKRLLLLNKAEGLYVGRRVGNEYELKNWCAKLGYTLDENPHVTVLYSTVAIPWVNREDWIEAKITGWTILGLDKAVVLTISCAELDVRWQNAIREGAVSTYASYTPHVTLFYLGADADTSGFVLPEIPDFPIFLEGERSANLGVSTASVFKSGVQDSLHRLVRTVTRSCDPTGVV